MKKMVLLFCRSGRLIEENFFPSHFFLLSRESRLEYLNPVVVYDEEPGREGERMEERKKAKKKASDSR